MLIKSVVDRTYDEWGESRMKSLVRARTSMCSVVEVLASCNDAKYLLSLDALQTDCEAQLYVEAGTSDVFTRTGEGAGGFARQEH